MPSILSLLEILWCWQVISCPIGQMAQKHKTSSIQIGGKKGQGNGQTKATFSPRPHRPPRQARSRFSDEYGVLLDQLIAARRAAGITQVEIAARLGKTQSHVSMCENREREISIIDLWRWCAALNMKVSDFLRQFEDAVAKDSASIKHQ